MKDDQKRDGASETPLPEQGSNSEAAGGQRLFLDRIEDDIAVLLLTTDEDETELEVERDLLPAEAREGDWLRVETNERGEPTYRLDPEATKAAKARVQDLLDELS